MIRRPPRSTQSRSSAASDVYKRQGLDRAQFVQTVVLPQGEFASFLRANPEDRRGLLQKVFGTEVYDQVEQRLAGMRAEANRTLAAARDGVGLAVEHLSLIHISEP